MTPPALVRQLPEGLETAARFWYPWRHKGQTHTEHQDAKGSEDNSRGGDSGRDALGVEREYVYRSPYMGSKVGSDSVTVRYGERRCEYDFGRNTITDVSVAALTAVDTSRAPRRAAVF